MLLATLSLSGIPPFSGFFSKDAVFVSALVAAQETPIALVLLGVGAISAMLTFFYSLRMMSLTFWGEPSEFIHDMEHHGHHVHEMKPTMWVPYGILVGVMIIVSLFGLVGLFVPSLSPEVFIEHQFHHMLEGMFHDLHIELHPVHVKLATKLTGVGLSVLMLIIGGVLGWIFYIERKLNPGDVVDNNPLLKGIHTFLWNRWYMNPLYYAVFVDGILALKQRIFDFFETPVMFKIGETVAKITMGLSNIVYGGVEVGAMEGAINTGVPKVVTRFYHNVKKIQTGLLSYNIIYMVILLIVIIVGIVLWG
jgi:NADH-quinone oxidoreductase subunit L